MTDNEYERVVTSTSDITEENIAKIAELFPDVVTEVEKTDGMATVIDFDVLKAKLGDVAEGMRERYQFTWPGKRAAKAEARIPIDKTMRPVLERSKDWDVTQNLYIEGDNLDALKILRETYAGKVKLIYIDPPYNTGHDFIYKDDFRKTAAEGRAENGDFDDEGARLVTNLETNGRFHSDWCSMIYPRLLLARDLLTDDGVIFISIDDGEQANLRKICDEVFGSGNFVANLIWKSTPGSNTGTMIKTVTETVMTYCKNISSVQFETIKDVGADKYKMKDEYYSSRGGYLLNKMDRRMTGSHYSESLNYPIHMPDGSILYPGGGCEKKAHWNWRWSQAKLKWGIDEGYVVFRQNDGKWSVYFKQYEKVDNLGNEIVRGTPYLNLLASDSISSARGTREMMELFEDKVFDYPKPIKLISTLLDMVGGDDLVVLDLFSGSATTAHAVMEWNEKNDASRSFIMVQLPEAIKAAAGSHGFVYRTICDIGEERIRRAGESIRRRVEMSENALDLDVEKKSVPDIGFRVLRIDSSGYEDVRKTPESYTQGDLGLDVDTTKAGRTSLDLLFECLPTFQIPYSTPITELDGEVFDGYTVYSVNHGQLIACFDENIPERVIRGMAQLEPKPSYAVVGEDSLLDSAARTNFTEIFRQSADELQGQTQVRIL